MNLETPPTTWVTVTKIRDKFEVNGTQQNREPCKAGLQLNPQGIRGRGRPRN
jgi:hypothetical protein